MESVIVTAAEAWEMAEAVSKALRPENCAAATQLLHMTAAHESGGFRYARQLARNGRPMGFSGSGAAGLCQLEKISIRESLRKLALPEHFGIAVRVSLLLFGRELSETWPMDTMWMRPESLHEIIQGWHLLGFAFCRLHYLWVRAAIPQAPDQAAVYAKRYYNTEAGAATSGDYYRAYEAFTVPVQRAMT